jgi:hypothetical protein
MSGADIPYLPSYGVNFEFSPYRNSCALGELVYSTSEESRWKNRDLFQEGFNQTRAVVGRRSRKSKNSANCPAQFDSHLRYSPQFTVVPPQHFLCLSRRGRARYAQFFLVLRMTAPSSPGIGSSDRHPPAPPS